MPKNKDTYTLVEYLNENHEWLFHSVYRNTTNTKALKHFAKEHGFEKEDIIIEHSGGESYLNDEVRAYKILIEDI